MALNPTDETNRFSLGIYISIACGNFITEFFIAAFGTRVFDYYENEIGIQSFWITGAFIIYAIYNMFNDPLIGHISDKPRNWWTKKGWGKRRPWILGAVPFMGIAFVAMFAVPAALNLETLNIDESAIWLTLWLLFSAILYDTFFSMFGTNFISLISEKFRSDKERRRQSTVGIVASTIGLVLGVTVPSIFGRYDDHTSWFIGVILVSIVGVIVGMGMWWGTKEPPEMVEREHHCVEEKIHDELEHCEEEKYPFLSVLKISLKDRNYRVYLILVVAYQCLSVLMVGSIPYLNRYVIQPAPLQPEFLIFVPPVFCSLLSIPFWNWLSRRIGSKKTIVIGGALIVASGIPFLFISNAVTVIVFVSLMGVAQVAFGMQFTPILADIVDELIAKIGRRREGLIIGVRTFFARLGIIVQAITFFLIHYFTGFDPDLPPGTPQSGIAILGLRIQLAVVPTIIMAIGVFIFWLRYDLDKKKKEIIHEILKTRKL